MGRVDSDLMSSSRSWKSLPLRPSIALCHPLEPRLRGIQADGVGSGYIAIARSHHRSIRRPLDVRDGARGAQSVDLLHPTLFELLRQRPIGQGCLPKDHQPGRFLVETVQERQIGPSVFPISKPLIQTLTGIRTRCMGVPTRWFVHDQQVFIFKDHTGRQGIAPRSHPSRR